MQKIKSLAVLLPGVIAVLLILTGCRGMITPPTVSVPSKDQAFTTTVPTISGAVANSSAVSTIALQFDGSPVQLLTASMANGAFSYTLPAANKLTFGSHTLTANTTGNNPDIIDFTVMPSVNLSYPINNSNVTSTTFMAVGTTQAANAPVTITVDNQASQAATVSGRFWYTPITVTGNNPHAIYVANGDAPTDYSDAASFNVVSVNDGAQDATLSVAPISGNAYAIAIDANGFIILAGNNSSGTETVVARYTPQGSLDTTFNTTGSISFTPAVTAQQVALAIQDDGSIVIVGGTSPASSFIVQRLAPNGTLDGTTFATVPGTATSVFIDSNDRIVVGGSNLGNQQLVRFNSDGTLDTSFAIATTPGSIVSIAQWTENSNSSDNRIVTAGNNGSGRTSINRYYSSGATTGMSDGTIFASSFGTITSMIVQADGSILALGNASGELFLNRYSGVDGSADTTFNFNAADSLGGLPPLSTLLALTQQFDGKLLVYGYASTNLLIARINADGTADSAFNTSGYNNTVPGLGYAGALQADGHPVIAGSSSTPNFLAVRYTVQNAAASINTIYPTSGTSALNPNPNFQGILPHPSIVTVFATGSHGSPIKLTTQTTSATASPLLGAQQNWLVAGMNLASDTYTVSITGRYQSGNLIISDPIRLTLCANCPPTIDQQNNEIAVKSSGVTGTTKPGATVTASVGSGVIVDSTTADSSGNFSLNVNSGSHALTATAVDTTRFESTQSKPAKVEVAVSPTRSRGTPLNKKTRSGALPLTITSGPLEVTVTAPVGTITGTSLQDTTIEFFVDGSYIYTPLITTDSNGVWSFALSSGQLPVFITATDADGNTSTVTVLADTTLIVGPPVPPTPPTPPIPSPISELSLAIRSKYCN